MTLESWGGKTGVETAPTVSIVILNYNGQRHLETCLPSLAELDYPRDKLETIVVDNASTDDTVTWLKRQYPDIRLVVNSTNLGFSAGINRGAEIASSSYLAFLNPDMRADRHWLAALTETISSSPDVVCAGSIVLNWTGDKVDYAGRPSDAFNLCPTELADASPILRAGSDIPILFASGGAMLIRRDVFLNLGGFDEDFFLYNEDVDLGWRLWLHGYRILRSARSLVFHKRGTSSQQLSPELVMCLAQKNVLHTMLKNMQDDQLWITLPSILWFLVDRSRWYVSARRSLGQAIRELTQEMETTWRKRLVTQPKRVWADTEIFAVCGHPFGFLDANSDHQKFKRYLQENDKGSSCLPTADATIVSHHITRLLYHAYKFNYERLLEQSLAIPPQDGAKLEEGAKISSYELSSCTDTQPRDMVTRAMLKAEQVARRILPTTWRWKLAPVWRYIKQTKQKTAEHKPHTPDIP